MGTGIKTTISDLLNIIRSNFHEKKYITQQSNTPGDQFGIIANIDKAVKGLNWKPSYKLEDGLKKMIKYYRL